MKTIKTEKFPGLNEIEIRPGLTLVRSETLGKYFVKETLDPIEGLPPTMKAEIEDFLKRRKR